MCLLPTQYGVHKKQFKIALHAIGYLEKGTISRACHL